MTVKIKKSQIPVALKYGYVESALTNKQWNEIIEHSVKNSNPYSLQALEDVVCNYIAKHAETPLVCLFSGGVDSTFMLSMARRCFSERHIKTVTVKFEEKRFDESAKAEAVLNGLQFSGGREFIPVKDPGSVLERMTGDNYRNLFFSSSIVPTYTAMATACKTANSILTGDGGDELFCGYDRYLWWAFKKKHRYAAKLVSMVKGNNKTVRGAKFLVDKYEDLCSIWSLGELNELVEGSLDIMKSDVFSRYGFIDHDCYMNIYKKMMLMDIGTELYGVEKYKVDQAFAMAVGDHSSQNVVSPFMDLDILKYCMTIPVSSKIVGSTRKVALRNSIRKRFVDYDKVAGMHKKGFGAPVSKWVKSFFDPCSFNPYRLNIKAKELFRYRTLEEMMMDHWNEDKDYGEKLWAVINLLYLINKGVVEVEQ